MRLLLGSALHALRGRGPPWPLGAVPLPGRMAPCRGGMAQRQGGGGVGVWAVLPTGPPPLPAAAATYTCLDTDQGCNFSLEAGQRLCQVRVKRRAA